MGYVRRQRGRIGLLGLLAATAIATPTPVMTLLGTGLCGALTTYSTLGYETIRLLQGNARMLATLNISASIIAGLGAAYLGAALAQSLAA